MHAAWEGMARKAGEGVDITNMGNQELLHDGGAYKTLVDKVHAQ